MERGGLLLRAARFLIPAVADLTHLSGCSGLGSSGRCPHLRGSACMGPSMAHCILPPSLRHPRPSEPFR